jgi:RHS repeat-associated protein
MDLRPGENSPTSIPFSGQYADEETGLYYNRYRYYVPTLDRHITPAPIGLFGALDLYSYTSNPVIQERNRGRNPRPHHKPK